MIDTDRDFDPTADMLVHDYDDEQTLALLYSLLQKRLLTCTLLKLCLTQVLFNKRRMQVK
jgi:hypothetical protein